MGDEDTTAGIVGDVDTTAGMGDEDTTAGIVGDVDTAVGMGDEDTTAGMGDRETEVMVDRNDKAEESTRVLGDHQSQPDIGMFAQIDSMLLKSALAQCTAQGYFSCKMMIEAHSLRASTSLIPRSFVLLY